MGWTTIAGSVGAGIAANAPPQRRTRPHVSSSKKCSSFFQPAYQILLECWRPVAQHLLLLLKFSGLHDLLRIDERAPVPFGKFLEPAQSARRYPLPDRYRQVNRIAVPAQFIEQNDYAAGVGLHPLGQGAALDDPAATEIAAWVDRTVRVIVTTAASAVRTGAAGVDRHPVYEHPYPSVTASGARLACSFLSFFHD